MAKIQIAEKDLTTAGQSALTDNIVYVPGYASIGPVNTPTLVRSYNEFVDLFGSTPYRFKADQTLTAGSIFAHEGDLEKSYIYAAELLRAGLPVLFERLYPESKINSDRASKVVDFYNQLLVATFEQNVVYMRDLTAEVKSLTSTIKLPIDQVVPKANSLKIFLNDDVSIQSGVDFTEEIITNADNQHLQSSTTLAEAIHNITKIDIDYTTGEIVLTFNHKDFVANTLTVSFELATSNDTIENLNLGTSIVWKVEGSNLNNQLVYKVFYKNPSDENFSEFPAKDAQSGKINYILETQKTPEGVEDRRKVKLVIADQDIDLTLSLSYEIGQKADQSITIKAKYPGIYGKNIQFKIEDKNEVDESGVKLLRLTLIYNTSEANYAVSLDYTNNRYIQNIATDLVDIECNLSKEFVDLGLFTIANTGVNQSLESKIEGDEITVSDIYDMLLNSDHIDRLEDRFNYDVKFLTTGAYPSYKFGYEGLANKLLLAAATRADAIALLDYDYEGASSSDHVANINGWVEELSKVYTVNSLGQSTKDYGVIVAPDARFNISTLNTTAWMPASFGYLKALAACQKTSPSWFAIAGAARGLVPDLVEPRITITSTQMDEWQQEIGIAVNPIMFIRNVGYCIYGNRTLHKNIDGLTASSFLNIRSAVCDIKKAVVHAANKLMFEVNDIILWNSFRSEIEPLLNQMTTGRGLRDYKLVRVESDAKGTVKGYIRLVPIEAVENFDITFTLEDNLVTVL